MKKRSRWGILRCPQVGYFQVTIRAHHAINMYNCSIAKSGGVKIRKELLAVLLAFEHIL